MTEIQQTNVDKELEIDKQVNLIDQFIQSGEFDKASVMCLGCRLVW